LTFRKAGGILTPMPKVDLAPAKPDAPLAVAALIVKNEAKGLPALFEHAAAAVDAYVIVDTGSTDGTQSLIPTLAAKHGVYVHLIEDPWDDDFSRSRNVGLDAIDKLWPPKALKAGRGPWILTLDGDDRLQGADALRAALERAEEEITEDPLQAGEYADVIALQVVSPVGAGQAETVVIARVWRQHIGARWVYPVHMRPDFGERAETVVAGTVEGAWILHEGYADAAHKTGNYDRALRIVRAKLGPLDPHRIYCECRALAAKGEWQEAAEVAQRGIVAHVEGEIVLANIAPWIVLANAHMLQGDVALSLRILADAVQFTFSDHPGPDFWWHVITTAGLGYMAASFRAAQGLPCSSATSHKAYDVLTALEDVGVFENGLPDEIMGVLGQFADRMEGIQVHAPRIDAWALPGAAVGWIQTNVPAPATIWEFGSGEGSTRLGNLGYRVTSVEHDLNFALVDRGPTVKVIHAPLEPATDGKVPWYEPKIVEAGAPKGCDLVVLDGPPGSIGREGILRNLNLLPLDVPILVDDTHRPRENTIAEAIAKDRGVEGARIVTADNRAFTVIPPVS